MIVKGIAYVGEEDGGEYWAEHVACEVEVQRTDENEIRLGVILDPGGSDSATVYLTLGEASRLAHMIGLYVLVNEAAAHEAMKYAEAELSEAHNTGTRQEEK